MVYFLYKYLGGIIVLRLVSSAPDLPKIFQKSLIDGLIQGFWLFMNNGGWYLVALAVAFAILEVLVKRVKRRG